MNSRHFLEKISIAALAVVLTLPLLPKHAVAQSDVRAEGKTSYVFNPSTGQTTLKFSRLSNYTTSPQRVYVSLALSKKAYQGGVFKPNFSQFVMEIPARSYLDNYSAIGQGTYPKKGTYFITVGIGVSNTQGGISLVSYLTGKKKTIGSKKRSKKNATRNKRQKLAVGYVMTDERLSIDLQQ